MPYKYSFRNKDTHPWRRFFCQNCDKQIETRDPDKRFCNSKCRGAYWRKYNEVIRLPPYIED